MVQVEMGLLVCLFVFLFVCFVFCWSASKGWLVLFIIQQLSVISNGFSFPPFSLCLLSLFLPLPPFPFPFSFRQLNGKVQFTLSELCKKRELFAL
ncbi:hypothetical protein BKA57DRAFT_54229 [Linnemannia elongata]|nr:hypothetical protein BKA57DRAFT_54229 [Linnemannia elongata]